MMNLLTIVFGSAAMIFKHYCDLQGRTVELRNVQPILIEDFNQKFPLYNGKIIKYDGYEVFVGFDTFGKMYPVNRKITFKTNPSLHKCSAKCLNGKHTGVCECSCGGSNHGRGMFTSLIED